MGDAGGDPARVARRDRMIGAVDMREPLPREDDDRCLAIMRVERHRRSGRDGGDAGEHRARAARRGGERGGDDAAAAVLDGQSFGMEQFRGHAVFSASGATTLIVFALVNSLSPSSPRSEEHTSELQSLMRLSYAVFCLKT